MWNNIEVVFKFSVLSSAEADILVVSVDWTDAFLRSEQDSILGL